MSGLPNFGTIPQPLTPFPPALDSLQRRVDANAHLAALLRPLGVQLLSEQIPKNIDCYIDLCASHPDITAYLCLQHGLTHQGVPGSPPIHWVSVSRPLQPVAGAWDAIYTGDERRAVSYPPSLEELPSALWTGFQAVITGSAFESSEAPRG